MNIASSERVALEAALSRIQIDLGPQFSDKLLGHLHLLIEKNKVLNLTRIESLEQGIILHLEDSLAVYPEFQRYQGRFCDIGTGGGFPGLPLGIVSGAPGVLLDSVKKKAAAVQGFIDELGLSSQLEALGLRSEELALEQPESFDVVVARAVSSLNVVEELATPLLKPDGVLIAMRGTESEDQLEYASHAATKLGLSLESSRKSTVGPADTSVSRSVYVYRKTGESQIKLPRRPGMATKKPLV